MTALSRKSTNIHRKPDLVVDKDHYIFPVIQYFDGKAKIIWPEEWKEQDLQIPDSMK